MQEIDFSRIRIDVMTNLNDPSAVLATRLPWNQIEEAMTAKFGHQNHTSKVAIDWDIFGATETLVGVPREASRAGLEHDTVPALKRRTRKKSRTLSGPQLVKPEIEFLTQ